MRLFKSRRFDVQHWQHWQHWQHCSVLKSVDGGTGRNRADFGLAPRAQVTGTAFVTASTAAVSTVHSTNDTNVGQCQKTMPTQELNYQLFWLS